jgi:iron complex outermembrane receptor protein
MIFKKHILASSVAALMLSTLAYADGDNTTGSNSGESTATQQKVVADNGSDKADVKTLDAVVVTGVRGGTPRTVTNSPVPIDVIKGSQLQATGKAGLRDALARVLPSFNVATINGGGSTYLVRSPSMRGLSGDQVLVLVNGKRRHNTALLNDQARIGTAAVPVDLDLIPTIAIERVEVLRDGAAAQYGSDAIAGVINIILKKDAAGGEVETFVGQNYKSDGEVGKQSFHVATALGEQGGFANFSFEAKKQRPWDRARDVIPALFSQKNPVPNDPRYANPSGWGKEYGLGGETTFVSAYNLELPLNDVSTFYSFSTLSYRDAIKTLGHREPNDLTALPGVPNAPYPDGPQARRLLEELDYQIATGLKTQVLGWDADLSTTYSKDDAELRTDHNANLSYGLGGKQEFLLNTQAFEQWTTNLDFSRAFDVGLYKPAQASAGLEYRWEKFEVGAGEPLSYSQGDWVIPSGTYAGQRPQPGLISVAGVPPADAGSLDRNVYAGYLDFNLPITKAWDVGLAGRYEKYDGGVGDTTSGKLSTRFEFIPNYAFRAAISNGFRAPSVAQTLFSSTNTATTFENGQQVRNITKQLRVDSPEAKALGATTLKPETSVNYSVGFTAKPTRNINLSIDVYQIDIDDRIVKTGLLRGVEIQKILQANGLNSNLQAARYYTNAVDTETRGIDVVLDYQQQLNDLNIDWLAGQIKWSLAYNHNRTEIKKLANTPAALASLGSGYTLFDSQSQLDITDATPKDKLILGANYSLNNWWLNLQLSRYGSYTEAGGKPIDDRTYSATWITDLEVGKSFSSGVSVAVGANNLFNKYPDQIGIRGWAGTYYNGMFSPYGLSGGFYYARLNYKF